MARITYKEMIARHAALEKAVKANDLDALTAIVSAESFDVNDVDDHGYSLLHHAAYASIKLLSYVLKLEGVNLYAVNDHGESVLHKTCTQEQVQAILAAGNDPSRCLEAGGRTFESILEKYGVTLEAEHGVGEAAVAAPLTGEEMVAAGDMTATADAE